MDLALTAAVHRRLPPFTAAGTVLAAVIQAWRTGPDRSRPGAADSPPPATGRGHLDKRQAESGA